jgi:Cof subfamily protein (haloacid dehalogenase superfamily)
MMALRLLVADIDGTLVRSDKSLSERTIAAAKRLVAAGVPISLISARPPSGMLWIGRKLGLPTPLGAFNGGTIVQADGSILSAARLAPGVARQALALIDRPAIVKWLFRAGRWHVDRLDGTHDVDERKAANQQPVVGGDFSDLLDAVDKIVAVSDDHAMLAGLESEVAHALGEGATVARSQVYYLDITAPAANKGDGVAALAAAAGVPLDAVAVIGDQRNDMAMFRRAGLSIAMAQGPDEVRACATRITGSNDEDGVAQAIDTILLPMVPAP